MTVYLDSSALVKLVVTEAGSAALRHLVADATGFASSALAQVEVRRAISRQAIPRRSPDLARDVERVLGDVSLVSIDEDILRTAASVEPVALRSLDAIHVATALRLGRELDALVTYDERMAEAARDCGLEVLSPS